MDPEVKIDHNMLAMTVGSATDDGSPACAPGRRMSEREVMWKEEGFWPSLMAFFSLLVLKESCMPCYICLILNLEKPVFHLCMMHKLTTWKIMS